MLSLYSLKESPYRSVLFAERRPIRALLVQMQVTLEMRLRPWVYCEWERFRPIGRGSSLWAQNGLQYEICETSRRG